jgi:tetratricopeptide (TPR) repeat protein
VTTSSFEALRHYLRGVKAFREARFQVAADELQQAVEVDSTFALAWYQLSSTADWLFDADLAVVAAERALANRERLSNRGRQLVEALFAYKSGRNREALRRYREFLTSYPDDVEAWYQLGELQFHAGQLVGVPASESQAAWDRLLFFEPDQITALIHSARLALSAGRLERADSIATRIFELGPTADRNLEFRAHLALSSPNTSVPDAVAAQLRAADDDILAEVVWSLGAFRDSPGYAMALIPYLTHPTRSEEARGLGHIIEAYLHAARGRIRDANGALDRAESVGHAAVPEHRGLLTLLPFRQPAAGEIRSMMRRVQDWNASGVPPSGRSSLWYSMHDDLHEPIREYLMGVLHAMMGERDEALVEARWLRDASVPIPVGSVASDLSLAVEAEVARIDGDAAAAEASLSKAERRMWYQYSVNSSIASQARERFVLGLLLEERGRFEEAISSLSFFLGYSVYDWIYVAPSHLRRAVMYDRLGNPEQAIEHYERFVTLWSECDEEFRGELESARRRLAELRP